MRTPTAIDYRRRLELFWGFVRASGLLTNTNEQLDQALVEFADLQFFEGKGASDGMKLKAAVVDYDPRLGARWHCLLPRFSRALKAWASAAPGHSRAPLPWSHAVLIVNELYVMGHPRLGLWVVLSFVCYLRPSEGLNVLVEDILRPSASSPHWSVQLHPEDRALPSKVGVFDDGIALDVPSLALLGPMLGRIMANRVKAQKIFPYTYVQAKDLFKLACERLHIADPSPYRLRHGGASHDRITGKRQLVEVKKRGRWATDASVRRYEKGTLLQKTELEIRPNLLRRAALLGRDLSRLVG